MSQWMLWMLLSWITGSPITALLVVAVLWLLGDRVTFRVLPDPLRGFQRWRRIGELRRTLADNPHDRRARLELGNLLLDARRPGQAAEVLAPNVEAGDDDVHTTFAMGAALARSGAWDRAEPFLAAARAREPEFMLGEIELEVGRMRVKRGDAAGAREPLERLVAARPGTVEGRYWLARALDALGEAGAAARVRADAWREYVSLPRFRRQHERPYAWRVRPSRPALVAVVVVAVVLVVLSVASQGTP